MPVVPFIPAIVGGVTSVVKGKMQSNAASKAANAQSAAADRAGTHVTNAATGVNVELTDAAGRAITTVNTARDDANARINEAADRAATGVNEAASAGNERFEGTRQTMRDLFDPYTSAGTRAIGTMEELMSGEGAKFNFTEDDPSYQWRKNEQMKAIERSAAARGTLVGGGTLKALQDRSANVASMEYQAAFDRFMQQRQQRAQIANQLFGGGLDATGRLASGELTLSDLMNGNSMRAAEYGGNAFRDAASETGRNTMYAGTYGGNMDYGSTADRGTNTMRGAMYTGDAMMGSGNAQAAGHVQRANAWSGAVDGLGGAATDAISAWDKFNPRPRTATQLPLRNDAATYTRNWGIPRFDVPVRS